MYNPFTLKGKRILVTGASSGIGRQLAISISKMGGQVVLTARKEERLLQTQQQLVGKGHQYIIADLAEENAIQHLVDTVPTLDGVVHNAGIIHPFPIKFLQKKHIEGIQTINYEAVVLLTAQLFQGKKINRNASFVFLSSIASQYPYKGAATYAATKAAIEAFSRVLALEHAAKGVRANCISPGMVATAMYEDTEKAVGKKQLEKYMEKYPLGVGEPEDVAHAAIFLLSNASKWITGTTLRLDGGLLVGIH